MINPKYLAVVVLWGQLQLQFYIQH